MQGRGSIDAVQGAEFARVNHVMKVAYVRHLLPTVRIRCVKVGAVQKLEGHHVTVPTVPPQRSERILGRHRAVRNAIGARFALHDEQLCNSESAPLDLLHQYSEWQRADLEMTRSSNLAVESMKFDDRGRTWHKLVVVGIFWGMIWRGSHLLGSTERNKKEWRKKKSRRKKVGIDRRQGGLTTDKIQETKIGVDDIG